MSAKGDPSFASESIAQWHHRFGRGHTATVLSLTVGTTSGPFTSRVHVAWTDFRSGYRQVLLSHSVRPTEDWSELTGVNRSGGPAFSPTAHGEQERHPRNQLVRSAGASKPVGLVGTIYIISRWGHDSRPQRPGRRVAIPILVGLRTRCLERNGSRGPPHRLCIPPRLQREQRRHGRARRRWEAHVPSALGRQSDRRPSDVDRSGGGACQGPAPWEPRPLDTTRDDLQNGATRQGQPV